MTGQPARASRTVRALSLLSAALALTTAACGGAEPAPAKAPAYERSRETTQDSDGIAEPRTIEEAEEQIAEARAALEPRNDEKAAFEPAPPTSKRPEPPPTPQAGKALREDREDVCRSPCRALASMKRAVSALCRMTGDSDNRCVDAKRTLDESTGRMAHCKCDVF